jgi:P2 family phage contractile tail tube protein
MSATSLLVLEAANIFVGNDPTASNHLVLRNVKFPTLEKSYVDFTPGGAIMGIEIDTHFNKLEVTFSLAGWSQQALSQVGIWSNASQQFSIYGMLRDRNQGGTQRVEGYIFGQLGKAAPDNFDRGTLNAIEYAIKGITHYELKINGKQIYLWDMFTNEMLVGGVDILADQNTALNIPGGTAPTVEVTSPITGQVGQVGP